MQWLKDWGPIIAPTLALVGVIVTVTAASRTYRRGQAETRKDRQRTLIADVIIEMRQYTDLQEFFVMAAGKFQQSDFAAWPDTDSGRRQAQLNQAVQAGLIRALIEIRDPKLRPLIIDLAVKQRGIMAGNEGEHVVDYRLPDDVRFEAVLVVTRRVRAIGTACDQLELAAIEVLPVEINLPPSWGSTLLRHLKIAGKRHGG